MPSPKKAKLADTGPRIARCLIRVSDVAGRDTEESVSRRGEFISPEQQMETARKWCKENNHVLDEEASLRLMDLNRSGFRLPWQKRYGTVQHLKDAENGEFHALIIYKVARLARTVLEGLQLWALFNEAGVEIVSATDKFDTTTSLGRANRTMLLMFAEMQAEDMSQYSRDMHRMRAKRGIGPQMVPSWIDRLPDRGGFVVNEQEAKPMRRMVELRLQMTGYTRIARTLNDEKLFRRAHAHNPTGQAAKVYPWTADRIIREFRAENIDRFVGTATYHIGDDVYKIKDAYPALVTTDEHKALVRIGEALRPTATGSTTRGASLDSPYLLSSRLFCGLCGGRMTTGTGGTSLQRSYRCDLSRTDRTRHQGIVDPGGQEKEGGSILVLAHGLEDAVARAVRLALTCQPVPPVARAPKRPTVPGAPPTTADAITAVRADMALLLDLLMDKRLTRELYNQRFEPLKAKLAELEAQATAEGGGDTETDADEKALLASMKDSQAAALAAVDDGDWRTVLLHAVARVDVPVTVRGVEYVRSRERQSPDRAKLRRCARVTLQWPIMLPTGEIAGSVIIAPIYRQNYAGEKELYLEDGRKVVLA